MNLEGIALKLLLVESDKNKALEYYSELRAEYFSNAFASVLSAIKEFYEKNQVMPSIEDLAVFRSRDRKTQSYLNALSTIDTKNIDMHFAIEELANHHAQNYTLDLIDNLLGTVAVKDRYELLESISNLPLRLEEKIQGSNCVHSPKSLSLFNKKDITYRFPTGISNEWDAKAGGYYRQDLILLGGKRGSGKSVVCANLMYAQHLQKKPSIYFTIEMQAQEVYDRFLAMKAGVPAIAMKMDTMTLEQRKLVCKAAAELFHGGLELYYTSIDKNPTPNFEEFETSLQKLDEIDEGRIIIYEDKMLSIATIDTVTAMFKAKYGEELLLVIVDYINQVILDTSTKDMYDWKDQTTVSKLLKNIARKHDLCVVSPYQIDSEGKARFSQGILDACDVAQLIKIIDKEKGQIEFETVKARSAEDSGKSHVLIDWVTLLIDPRPVVLETDESEEPVKVEKSKESSMELTL